MSACNSIVASAIVCELEKVREKRPKKSKITGYLLAMRSQSTEHTVRPNGKVITFKTTNYFLI